MMGSVFRFKQFEVDQGQCAMKINTDGVLLGAMAHAAHAVRILDIGTGTGVIALMLAQAHPDAHVDAVEIDPVAAAQAKRNFAHSPFTDRLQVLEGSFADFRSQQPYDLIVSNPPFYTDSLHNPDERRRLARHTDDHFFEQLFAYVADMLTDDGVFHFIVPTGLADWITENLLACNGLFCSAIVNISSYADTAVIRRMVSVRKRRVKPVQENFFIYAAQGVHSSSYKACLAPYFLAY